MIRPGDPLVTTSPRLSEGSDTDQRRVTIEESNMARFWELRGRRVFERNGVVWGEYRGGFYSQLPYQQHLDLQQDEIDSILRTRRLRGLRFTSTTRPGAPGGMYVVRPAGYGLESVSKNHRSCVRAGLENCRIRTVDPAELLIEGPQLNRDTMARQDRLDESFLDPVKWRRMVEAVGRCPGITVHGAYRDGRLAAYLISIREGDWLHLLYKMSRAEDLKFRPNHALDFWVLRWAASVPGIRYVGNGSTSVVPNQGLDRYKRWMGYGVAEHKLCVHFHPSLAPMLSNRVTISLFRGLSVVFPKEQGFQYQATILEASRKSRSSAGSTAC